jgi:periplasmic mercuric ion binding protein
MKNIIVFCFATILSQAAFAQASSATQIPAAEKKSCAAGNEKTTKSCCAAGGEKAGTSCSDHSTGAVAPITPATKGMVKKTAVAVNNQETAQFLVFGNCGMCKKTIETAAKGVSGVEKADWNVDTHQFSLVFDPAKTSTEKVHQAIAAAGYDTDIVRGNDMAYNNLHSCCQYERRK